MEFKKLTAQFRHEYDEYLYTGKISPEFRELINLFTSLKGKNILYFIHVMCIVHSHLERDIGINYTTKQRLKVYVDLFGKDYWWYYENFQISDLDSCQDTFLWFLKNYYERYTPHKFATMIEEIEFMRKTWLNDIYKRSIDVNIPLYKFYIELIKDGVSVNDITELYNYYELNHGYELSVTFVSFMRDYCAEFSIDLFKMLNPPRSINYENFDFNYYINCIKNMTRADYKFYHNPFYYYLDNYEDTKLIAIKSFIASLHKSAKYADGDSLEMLKSSLDALYEMPGFNAFIKK